MKGMSQVKFSSKVATLMKATSDDMKPIPGHLYNDIAKITYESLDYCEYMADYLVGRLAKNSLFVKLKVLLIMKHLLEKGHDEFAKCLRRKDSAIRDCKGLNGPLDPLHGDSFYVKVRENADIVLDNLFNFERNSSNTSSSFESTSKKMEGFGYNANNQTKEGGDTIYDGLKGAINNITKSVSSMQFPSSGRKENSNVSNDTPSNFQRQSETGTNFLTPRPSEEPKSYSSPPLSGVDWFEKSNKREQVEIKEESRMPPDGTNRGEKKLVEEITTIQGMRSFPSKSDLDLFVKRSQIMNSLIVVKELNDKLKSQDTRVKVKVLCVLEALLESHMNETSRLIKKECKDELLKSSSSSHSVTKSKALKILDLLGVNVERPIQKRQAPQQREPQVDLFSNMDFSKSSSSSSGQDILTFDMQPTAQSSQQSSKPTNDFNSFDQAFANPSNSNNTDLFSGLSQVSQNQTSTSTSSNNDFFFGETTQNQTASSTSGTGDLFKSSSQTQNQTQSNKDIFSGFSNQNPTGPSVSNSGDLFPGLSQTAQINSTSSNDFFSSLSQTSQNQTATLSHGNNDLFSSSLDTMSTQQISGPSGTEISGDLISGFSSGGTKSSEKSDSFDPFSNFETQPSAATVKNLFSATPSQPNYTTANFQSQTHKTNNSAFAFLNSASTKSHQPTSSNSSLDSLLNFNQGNSSSQQQRNVNATLLNPNSNAQKRNTVQPNIGTSMQFGVNSTNQAQVTSGFQNTNVNAFSNNIPYQTGGPSIQNQFNMQRFPNNGTNQYNSGFNAPMQSGYVPQNQAMVRPNSNMSQFNSGFNMQIRPSGQQPMIQRGMYNNSGQQINYTNTPTQSQPSFGALQSIQRSNSSSKKDSFDFVQDAMKASKK